MSSEAPSFAEEASNIMLKELQSWWEIPSMAQYISLFRESFNLPEVEIEELENGFIDDTIKGPNEWLRNLIIAFLRSILPARINVENFELHLRKLIRRKWSESPFSEKENPLEEDKPFHELSLRSKVEVFYCFCLYRLDKNDIAEQMKSMDAEALRVQKLGSDDVGNTYWYFYGTRLYKEDASDENKPWDEEWKEQKRNSLKKKRGRGRPRKRPRSDGESDYEDLQDTSRKSEFMNVDEKSRWSVVCDTIEEWVSFAEKFKNSKSKTEKSLFQIIQENFLPTLNKIYEEKERKLQEKIRELMPVREKIVTRRETRRLRGEPVDYAALNGGYYSDEEVKSTPVIKDRAQRLEERNKRASEAENVQIIFPHKKVKHDKSNSESENSNSSIHEKSESSSDIDVQSQMEKLLTSVKLHKDAWPFLYPVDEDDAPGYYEIIKDPIDLSRIENRLFKGEYETVGDLDEDFSKMVSNCELYNGEYHPYSKMAQTLRKVFRKEVARLLDSLEATENVSADSEGSNDSQYHSSSNSVSPHHEPSPPPTVVTTPKERKKSKVGSKKKKRTTEALELLAQASDLAVQDNANRTSPPEKKSPIPQDTRSAPVYVPSSMPSVSSTSSSSPETNKASVPVINSSFASVNSVVPRVKKNKPVIIRTKALEPDKQTSINNVSSTSLNTISNENINNTLHQSNIYQSFKPKTVPVVLSGYNTATSPNQSDLGIKNNPVSTVTMQSNNMCMSNGLPVVQQVLFPAGAQQIQMQNNGQFVLASPQNTVRLFGKGQNVQIQNNLGQLNQGFTKVMPQIITSSPIMQVSKDGMQSLQFQALPQNSTQSFTQVGQNPQFVNIPYMFANQNSVNNTPSQPVVNFQHYQLTSRQMQINDQGNS